MQAPSGPDALASGPSRCKVGRMEVETTDALPCPLCGYDLRGLPPGRCPECGHGFDPVELRRAEENRHPYLLEHHPKRPIRATMRTILSRAAARPVLAHAYALRRDPCEAAGRVRGGRHAARRGQPHFWLRLRGGGTA